MSTASVAVADLVIWEHREGYVLSAMALSDHKTDSPSHDVRVVWYDGLNIIGDTSIMHSWFTDVVPGLWTMRRL